MLELYDVVELREAISGEQLPAGAVGTVVHIFNAPSTAYEVEFVDTDGHTIAMVTLRADQVIHRGG
ncbi:MULTISPECIES: DUF4926 domain-containing protein [Micromonospora]|uniref:DUF4926 domain-containing protein n=1 Tax=Micromonospora TaxID=1873 RepID=UPI001EE8F685|nr:DUF4926 domain-containing protein [Micromonospora hortensis]MCG5452711.1 DUF4926 domain-containing protein [Micromonospora hortensis]WTI05728.1 DUF4926 domain-containing protein [Micromonospora sp. NBC_00821]